MTDTPRTTFRFNETEAAFASLLRRPGSAEAEALRELTGRENLKHAPEATLLHTLVEAGMQAVQDKAENVRYERLAEFLKSDKEHQAWRSSRRSRAAHRAALRENA